jgi:ribonuclease P protein component
MSEFRLRRGERLKSHKEIGLLFGRESQSFGKYPLRLVWREVSERRSEFPIQFALSVPKKRFKHAVDRNRLRRRIREAYRLHKHELYAKLPAEAPQLAWMVIYIGREEQDYASIARSMRKLMERFIRDYRPGLTN